MERCREVEGSWENGGRRVKAVRFDEYGGVDVLRVVDVPTPTPGPGWVVIAPVAPKTARHETAIRTTPSITRQPM